MRILIPLLLLFPLQAFAAGKIIDADVAPAGTANLARNKLASGTNYAWCVNSSLGVMSDVAVTASRAVATDVNGSPVASATSATELGYVSGVTSAIQTQINGKQATIANQTASAHQWFNSFTAGTFGGAQPAFTDISGSVAAAQLPNPSATTLGGIESYGAVSHQWINAISTLGVAGSTQPAFSDISGSVAAAQLPNPSATTLGGVESIAAVAHNFVTSISTSGVPAQGQPAFTDISGSVAASQLPNPSATTLGGIESYASVTHQWINTISTLGVAGSTQPAFSDLTGAATIAQTTAANHAQGTCNTATTIDWSLSNNFTMTLTNAATCALTWSNASSGQSICIDIYQPGTTGSGAVSFATTTLKSSAYTMTTGANATDTICVKYNGTDYRMVPQQNLL